MKMKTRFISMLLCIVMVLGLFPVQAFAATVVASGYCGGEGDGTNLTWTLDNDGVLTISGTGAMANYNSKEDQPWYPYRDEYKTLVLENGIGSIGNSAFWDCSGFTGSLTIPDSVTSIGDNAFNACSGFTGSLTIPNNVTSIEYAAFCGCSGLTGNLTIPNSVTSIGEHAFNNCSGFTGSLTIPDSVTSIGNGTFWDCSGFTGNLTIPDSVTSIGVYAFSGCSGFTGSLTIPDSVTSIGNAAFRGCGFTGSLTIPNGVTSIEDYAFDGCSGFTGNLTIPDSVTSIWTCAFRGCSGFTGSLTIPDSVTSIGAYAFEGCSGFTGSLTIPDSVTSIGEYAFRDCSGFTGSLTIPDSVTSIGKSAFRDCSGFTGSLTIPNSVTGIGDSAFDGCSGFTGSLTIPNGVTSIGYMAFRGCSGLTGSLTIPNSVTSIGEYAFRRCSGFTGSLTIPNGVTGIGNSAFEGCSGFTGSLTIPDSVTSIGEYAFRGCGFTDVFFVGDAPSVTSASSTRRSFNTDVILHYIPGRSGWTDSDAYDAEAGTWNGYQLEEWSGLDVTFISGTAFLDTGWGDDEFELYPRIQNKASITEYGFSCWDKNGNAINGIDNTTVPTRRHIEPGTRNYICCMAYIDEYGLHGELKEGEQYFWTVYVICDGVKYTSPEYSFVFSIEGTRFPPVRGISLGVSTISMKVGEEETLNPTITPENAINKNVFWTSSNEAVATVTDGTVTAVAEGTALITATTENSGLKSSCTATVSAASTDGPTIVDSGYCGGEGDGTNLTWTLDSDGVLTISGTGEMADYSSYNSTPWYSYLYHGAVTSLIIEYGVSTIGDWAFSQFPGSLELPDSLISIGYAAFQSARFDGSLIIPSSVVNIDNYAFAYCDGFHGELVLSDSIARIGAHAFDNCYAFTGNLIIPKAVKSIDNYAFYNCCGFKGNLSLPDSLKYIGSYAFAKCDGFTGNLNFPESITYIGECAFWLCTGFTGNLSIPNSVTEIDQRAFWNCSGLTGNLTLSNSIKTINYETFCGCRFTGNLVIPNSVTRIVSGAFRFCDFSGDLVIPDSVTSIGEAVFAGCYRSTGGFTGSLTIGNSVTSIGNSAFFECSGFTGSLTIGNSVTSIGNSAFYGCSGFTGSLTIPDSVTSIGEAAFENCIFPDVYFGGDAPTIYSASDEFPSFSADVILYYIPGTSGWIDCDAYDPEVGTWNGYQLEEWTGLQDAWNGTDPAVSTVYIKSMTPNQVCLPALNTATIEFNTDVKKGSGAITLMDKKTGQTLCSIPVSGDAVQCSGSTVTVNFSYETNSRSRSCYVQIDSGAFVSVSGTPFYGLYDADAWNVELYKQISGTLTVTREWEQAGIAPFRRDDRSKPPIPAGSDEQYAQMLSLWAEKMGIDWLTPTRARALLDTPVYLPVTDSNGASVLLNDGGTTVRQVIEDVIFAGDLQEYIQDLDQQIESLEAYTTQNRALFYNQEAAIYNMVQSWYPQIQKYLTRRNQKSNILWSLSAPEAYRALLTAADSYGGTVYTYIKPILKAELQYSDFTESLRSLENYRTFSTYKSEAENINLAYKAGKTAYTAYAEGKYGGVLNFYADLTMKYFGASDNQMLQEISTVWKQYDSMKSAVSLSMVLGSSIGMFPLVMDLSQTLYQKTTDQVKAVYFIGDYYIQEKYPSFYNAVYDSESCMPEHIIDAYVNGSLPDAYMSDMALYNWTDYLCKTDLETVLRSDCIEMRRDLANYTMLLQYIKSIDTVETIRMLMAYLDAENNAGATTSLYVKCPVTVEIYDESGEILASLSSEDASIQDCEYGSLYLMGEDNEAKVFVLNSNANTAKIIPYDGGTMDVLLVQTDENGTQAASYFEAVSITQNMPLELNMPQQKLVENGTELMPESSIPVQSITISGEQAVAVGQSTVLQAHIGPAVASDPSVTWRSEDDTIASVTQDGLVTANAEGITQIIAEASNGVVGMFSIQSYTAAESITLETKELSMTVGESFNPGATVSPANVSHSLQWSSSEPGVASVDEDGLIQAYAAGATILRAEVDGVLAEIYVSVFDSPLTVTTYQSNTNGDQLKVDIINRSQNFFTGTIIVAIYNNGQCLYSNSIAISLAAQDKMQQYLTLNALASGDDYTVKAFVLNEEFAPTQTCSQGVIIG